MSMIYIVQADGSQATFEEPQLYRLVMQGSLTPQMLYWKEGMPEWRPLLELFPSLLLPQLPQAVPRPVPAAALRVVRLAKNPDPLATVLLVMLGVYFLISLVDIYCYVGQMRFVFVPEIDLEEATASDKFVHAVAILSLFFYLATTIPFGMWIYRVNCNAHSLVHDLKISPGWAVGSLFVPFVNLVVPCAAMLDVWKVSKNPEEWRKVPASFLVLSWWFAWLLTNIVGQIIFHMPKVHDRGSLATFLGIAIVHHSINVVLAALAFAMILITTNRQKKLATEYWE